MAFINRTQPLTKGEILTARYTNARRNILILIIFTVLNIFLALTGSSVYLLFSAYIPYTLVEVGLLLSGKYPEEYYEALYGEQYHTLDFSGKGVILVLLVIVAAFVLLWYFISWKATRKASFGWMLFTLIYFALDTVVMLLIRGVSFGDIFDLLFHGWVLYSLTAGILALRKLRNLPEEVQE